MKKIKNKLISSLALSLVLIVLVSIPSFAEFKIKSILIENPLLDNSEQIKILEEKLEQEKDKPKNVIVKKVYDINKKDFESLEKENKELKTTIELLTSKMDSILELLSKKNNISIKENEYVKPLLPFEDQLTQNAKDAISFVESYPSSHNLNTINRLQICNSRISKAALEIVSNQTDEKTVFIKDLNLNIKEFINFPTVDIAYKDLINIRVKFFENGILEYVTITKK